MNHREAEMQDEKLAAIAKTLQSQIDELKMKYEQLHRSFLACRDKKTNIKD